MLTVFYIFLSFDNINIHDKYINRKLYIMTSKLKLKQKKTKLKRKIILKTYVSLHKKKREYVNNFLDFLSFGNININDIYIS